MAVQPRSVFESYECPSCAGDVVWHDESWQCEDCERVLRHAAD